MWEYQGRTGGIAAGVCHVLREPQNKARVYEADERSRAFNRRPFAGGRVGEAEKLLEVTETDFYSPTTSVGFKNLHHGHQWVSAKEYAQVDISRFDADDDCSKEVRPTSSVPLGIHSLVVNGSLLAAEER